MMSAGTLATFVRGSLAENRQRAIDELLNQEVERCIAAGERSVVEFTETFDFDGASHRIEMRRVGTFTLSPYGAFVTIRGVEYTLARTEDQASFVAMVLQPDGSTSGVIPAEKGRARRIFSEIGEARG